MVERGLATTALTTPAVPTKRPRRKAIIAGAAAIAALALFAGIIITAISTTSDKPNAKPVGATQAYMPVPQSAVDGAQFGTAWIAYVRSLPLAGQRSEVSAMIAARNPDFTSVPEFGDDGSRITTFKLIKGDKICTILPPLRRLPT